MPFLDAIVSQLNDTIITSSLNLIPAGKIKAYGVAETMIDVIETDNGQKILSYPASVDDDGEATMIEADDRYDLIMYHRLENIANALAANKETWGRGQWLLETVNMSLIVIAFRNKVRRPAYWIEGAIKDKIPDRISIKDHDDDTEILQRSEIKIGMSNFDKITLLGREYNGVQLNFTHLIIFELKYRAESVYKKGCFNACVAC